MLLTILSLFVHFDFQFYSFASGTCVKAYLQLHFFIKSKREMVTQSFKEDVSLSVWLLLEPCEASSMLVVTGLHIYWPDISRSSHESLSDGPLLVFLAYAVKLCLIPQHRASQLIHAKRRWVVPSRRNEKLEIMRMGTICDQTLKIILSLALLEALRHPDWLLLSLALHIGHCCCLCYILAASGRGCSLVEQLIVIDPHNRYSPTLRV